MNAKRDIGILASISSIAAVIEFLNPFWEIVALPVYKVYLGVGLAGVGAALSLPRAVAARLPFARHSAVAAASSFLLVGLACLAVASQNQSFGPGKSAVGLTWSTAVDLARRLDLFLPTGEVSAKSVRIAEYTVQGTAAEVRLEKDVTEEPVEASVFACDRFSTRMALLSESYLPAAAASKQLSGHIPEEHANLLVHLKSTSGQVSLYQKWSPTTGTAVSAPVSKEGLMTCADFQ